MIAESNCEKRQCKYYVGIIQPKGTEEVEKHFCGAFLDGIPDDIAYGDNPHRVVVAGQDKPYIFQKDKDPTNHWTNLNPVDIATWQKINQRPF
jgi:hypothetical protein